MKVMIKNVYSTRTTYAPNGEVFAKPTPLHLTWFTSIDDAVVFMCAAHWYRRATETQAAKLYDGGFMDVVTYSEESNDE